MKHKMNVLGHNYVSKNANSAPLAYSVQAVQYNADIMPVGEQLISMVTREGHKTGCAQTIVMAQARHDSNLT
jgi:hypothetical protein